MSNSCNVQNLRGKSRAGMRRKKAFLDPEKNDVQKIGIILQSIVSRSARASRFADWTRLSLERQDGLRAAIEKGGSSGVPNNVVHDFIRPSFSIFADWLSFRILLRKPGIFLQSAGSRVTRENNLVKNTPVNRKTKKGISKTKTEGSLVHAI